MISEALIRVFSLTFPDTVLYTLCLMRSMLPASVRWSVGQLWKKVRF